MRVNTRYINSIRGTSKQTNKQTKTVVAKDYTGYKSMHIHLSTPLTCSAFCLLSKLYYFAKKYIYRLIHLNVVLVLCLVDISPNKLRLRYVERLHVTWFCFFRFCFYAIRASFCGTLATFDSSSACVSESEPCCIIIYNALSVWS